MATKKDVPEVKGTLEEMITVFPRWLQATVKWAANKSQQALRLVLVGIGLVFFLLVLLAWFYPIARVLVILIGLSALARAASGGREPGCIAGLALEFTEGLVYVVVLGLMLGVANDAKVPLVPSVKTAQHEVTGFYNMAKAAPGKAWAQFTGEPDVAAIVCKGVALDGDCVVFGPNDSGAQAEGQFVMVRDGFMLRQIRGPYPDMRLRGSYKGQQEQATWRLERD